LKEAGYFIIDRISGRFYYEYVRVIVVIPTRKDYRGGVIVKAALIGCMCVLTAGAAWPLAVTVGGTGTYAAYPFRGC
jgi:hypothetical protein